MTLTWEEQSRLALATAAQVVQWLALLDNRSKAHQLSYLLVGYSSLELKRLNERVTVRITELKHDAATG